MAIFYFTCESPIMKIYVYPIFLLVIIFSCNRKQSSPPVLFQLTDNTGIDFSNNIQKQQGL